MTVFLGDVNARARGLRTRLLSLPDRERLTRARSLLSFQRELASLGLVRDDVAATPQALEAAIRRRAADLLAILGRWCSGDRQPIFAVLLEDEERRAIQAALRGAEQAASGEARLSGLVPTVGLSERALRVLTSQPTIADVVRTLVLWNHPLGAALVPAVSGPSPSLFDVEVALSRAFAGRALAHAKRGGVELIEYVRQVVDVMNAWSVLLHFPERGRGIAPATFIEGGAAIDYPTFDGLMHSESLEIAREGLSIAFRASRLGASFASKEASLSTLENEVLKAQISELRRASRLHPDGAAPVVLFALQLRGEVLDLRRVLWGVVLEAPPVLLSTSSVM